MGRFMRSISFSDVLINILNRKNRLKTNFKESIYNFIDGKIDAYAASQLGSSFMQMQELATYQINESSSSSRFSEKTDNSARFNRFYNSLLNYDYKTGNYVGY